MKELMVMGERGQDLAEDFRRLDLTFRPDGTTLVEGRPSPAGEKFRRRFDRRRRGSGNLVPADGEGGREAKPSR